MLLASQAKDTPDTGLFARCTEHVGKGTGDLTSSIKHFFSVVHDSHGGVFWEDNQVHSRQSLLGSFDNIANLFGILNNFVRGMKPWHGVLEDAHSDRVYDGREIQ